MDNTVTTQKAARYIGRSPTYLRALHDNGVLRADSLTPGGHRRYRISTLDSFLAGIATHGTCLFFCGVPDSDYPADYHKSLQQKVMQHLMGMGIAALEDVSAPVGTKTFYAYFHTLLALIAKPEVRRLAIAHMDVIPPEALAPLASTCAVNNTQLIFLTIS